MNLRHVIFRAATKLLLPLLPRRARMPFHYWSYLLGGQAEPELRQLNAICRSLCKQRRVAIDVGVNLGLFSYALAQIFDKVVSFEINEEQSRDLVRYGSEKINVIYSGLSSKPGQLDLYIPVLNGIQLDGWASVSPGNCPETDKHVTKTVSVNTLDSYTLREVDFVKIDVEGHELEVLHGATATIAANRPVILVEFFDQNAGAMHEFFESIDYVKVPLRALTGVEGKELNHIFVPREQQGADALPCCARISDSLN